MILKTNERGALMIELLAVLALIGTMGTVLYRQILQRNEEIENVNLAAEMRVMKDAFAAYIQTNKAVLENWCRISTDDPTAVVECPLTNDLSPLEDVIPDGYSETMDSYRFYLYHYTTGGNNRHVLYGMIVPTTDASSPMPAGMTIKRAARVANLVGADGGIFNGLPNDMTIYGTQGGWQLDCPNEACEKNEPLYAAITGMDIFVPEGETPAGNIVAVPREMAFENLHSASYFSVGNGDYNCFQTDAHGDFINHLDGNGDLVNDDIRHTGETVLNNPCDPLFWVGTPGNAGQDNSQSGQVYIKNNLYIGRDNAGQKQAVAIEKDNDTGSKIRVYNTEGTEQLTLDGSGRIVARNPSGQEAIQIDAATGRISLSSQEVQVTVNGMSGTVTVPDALIISSQGIIDTNKPASYYKANGSVQTDTYKLDPANISLMNDIRLTSLGGTRLSEILPNYIMKDVRVLTFSNGNYATGIPKPTCPTGYAKAIIVNPTAWSQYVKDIDFKLNAKQVNYSGAINHTHTVPGYELKTPSTPAEGLKTSTSSDDGSITLTHRGQVEVTVQSAGDNWNVLAQYSDGPASDNDKITVMAQTYCVFDKQSFNQGNNGDYTGNNYQGSPVQGTTGNPENTISGGIVYGKTNTNTTNSYLQVTDKTAEDRPVTSSSSSGNGGSASNTCAENQDCRSTQKCNNNQCVSLGHCQQTDGEKVSSAPETYCIAGTVMRIECFKDEDCEKDEQTCSDYQCRDK